MTAMQLLQLRLTRPDGTVLAWLNVPDGWSVVSWGPMKDGNFWVGMGLSSAAVRPPWRFEQRILPDGEWVTLGESAR
jgi:endo-1,4-beta-D-glucanase Y